MIIHQDSLIVLNYDPQSDILSVKWPDLIEVPTSVIQYSFSKLVDSINHYHITKLLIDSKGTITQMSDAEYKPLAMKLASDLAATNLKKIARVVSDDQLREARTRAYGQEIQAKVTFIMKSKEFEDKDSALLWLAEAEN